MAKKADILSRTLPGYVLTRSRRAHSAMSGGLESEPKFPGRRKIYEQRAYGGNWVWVDTGRTEAVSDTVRRVCPYILKGEASGTLIGYLDSKRLKVGGVDVKKSIAALTNSEPRARVSAVVQLSRTGKDAVTAIPALVELLKDSDLEIKWNVINTLGNMGVAASSAIPHIAQQLESEDERIVSCAAVALGKFGSYAARFAPEIAKKLRFPPTKIKQQWLNANIINTLERMGFHDLLDCAGILPTPQQTITKASPGSLLLPMQDAPNVSCARLTEDSTLLFLVLANEVLPKTKRDGLLEKLNTETLNRMRVERIKKPDYRQGDAANCTPSRQGEPPKCNWWDAKAYCSGRLPSVAQLRAWYNSECAGGRKGSIYCSWWVWSGEEISESHARGVHFSHYGIVSEYGKDDASGYVRCR